MDIKTSFKAGKFPKVYSEELKEIKEILDGMEVPFWLIGGVLLGHVRDGKFIDHDDDMDIAMRHPCPDIPEAEQREWLENRRKTDLIESLPRAVVAPVRA